MKTLTLEVIDENDPPQNVRLVGNSIAESSPTGSVIGTANLSYVTKFDNTFPGRLTQGD